MIKFSSMPNFRILACKRVENDDHEEDFLENTNSSNNEIMKGDKLEENSDGGCSYRKKVTIGKIYRSSRPDFLTEGEVEEFKKINFKSIIDFRSHFEYKRSHPHKLLDRHYSIYKVKLPYWHNYKPHERVQCVRVKAAEGDHDEDDSSEKKHYLINFFNLNYIWEVFNRVSIWSRIISIFYLLIDTILGNDRRYFVRLFAKQTLNKQGLIGQYIDIINHSRASICAALKLLCDPNNLPVMLNCAHGKDRTGIVSALVLSCLCFSKDFICSDYAKSAVELEPIRELLEKDIVEKYHLSSSFIDADSNTMRGVLDYINENYGSVTSYLEKIGFSLAEQQQLRSNLLG